MIKKGLFFTCFLFLSIFCHPQKKAVQINAAITEDIAFNIKGGVDQGSVLLGNIDFTLTLDTEKLHLWKGGTFFIYALNNHGKSLSNLVGDVQIVNNIEALSNTRLFEFWYRQKIGNFLITLGQHGLDSEFAISKYGFDPFIHSSFGIQPDISTNIPVSIFPVATLGVVIQWDISKNLHFINGFYDGSPGTELENPNSLHWKLSSDEGMMTIHEIQYNNGNHSTYKLGIWSHTANGNYGDNEFSSRNGVYFITDQLLFSEKNTGNQGLGMFAQIGIPLKNVVPIKLYLGGGFVYNGLFSKRDEDMLGLALAHTSFSEAYQREQQSISLGSETAIELTYKMVLNSHFSIQPDFQYVMNPQGTNSYKNAFVGIFRLKYEI